MANFCENNISVSLLKPLTQDQLDLLNDYERLRITLIDQYREADPLSNNKRDNSTGEAQVIFGTPVFPFKDDTFSNVKAGQTSFEIYAVSAWTPCNKLIWNLAKIVPIESATNAYHIDADRRCGIFNVSCDDELDDDTGDIVYYSDHNNVVYKTSEDSDYHEDGDIITLTVESDDDMEVLDVLFLDDDQYKLEVKEIKKPEPKVKATPKGLSM